MNNMKQLKFSAIVVPEGNSYSAWCPEIDIASQGDTKEEATANLKEAVELHLECLTKDELKELRKKSGKRTVMEIAIPIPSAC